ncbi:MAG: nucleoside-diphosphate kinase [Firmicutes bacterium]|nr:nucleoside-diphosphate kinase [Bacillota bacterium]
MEKTFVIIKPEAVARGLVGEILARFERKGLKLERLEMIVVDEATAREHYCHHSDKPFFPGLIRAITAGPAVACMLEGPSAVAQVRNLVGATDPVKADPGSIRGDLAVELPFNMVHAADSPEAAQAEIGRFFGGGRG